jgi:type II secretory pathway pseudopilin PulG
MLTVMAIIAVLAAMIFPVTKGVNRARVKARIKADLTQVETAIELYHTKRGHYPPDNHLPNGHPNLYVNQLFYELAGTTNWSAGADIWYQTLDGRSRVDTAAIKAGLSNTTATAVSGLVNTTGPTSADEGSTVVNCLKGAFRADQIGQTPSGFMVLVGSVPLPSHLNSSSPPPPAGTPPYPGSFQLANNTNAWYCGWRYNSSSPTNNPSAYDLWIDVIIDGQINRFSNWTRDAVIVNSP